MARSRKHEIGVGLLVLTAFGLLAWMSLKVGALGGLGKAVRVEVRLTDAMGLTEGAAVKVAGVEVGTVDRIAIDHDTAVLAVSVDPDAGIRDDVRVQVRARSLLGEKFLELQPQSRDAPLLVDGAVLSDSRPATEIDQLVNALGPLVAQLDPAAVDAVMASLSKALEDDPDKVARMLENLDTILTNGAKVSEELPALVDETRGAVREVKAVARDARPVVDKAGTAITHADESLGKLDTLADQGAGTLDELDALAREARVVVKDGQRVVAVFDRNSGEIEQIIGNVAEIDKWEVRRWLREEGIKVRLKESEVVPTD